MDYSFYGGRPGASFVLKYTFLTVEEMEACFNDGGAVRDESGNIILYVNYDEYVLINTKDKTDVDNGKLYKRTAAGPKLIGQINGAPGAASKLLIKDYDQVVTDGAALPTFTQGQLVINESFLPGKDGENYNDTILWASYAQLDEDHTDASAYIGFKIPYPILELEAQYKEYGYEGEKIVHTYNGATASPPHPFYNKWTIYIPQGQPGNQIENLRPMLVTDDSAIVYPEGKNKADDIGKWVIVYDVRIQSDAGISTVTTHYFGDYNNVSSFELSETGVITVNYLHEEPQQISQQIKWISSVTLDTDTGLFTVHYNDETAFPPFQTSISWVNNVSFQEDGSVTISYTDRNETKANLIKWVNSMTLRADGKIAVQYNYGDPVIINESNPVIWPNTINLSADGLLEIIYNDGSKQYATNKIKWVADMLIDTGANEGEGTQKLKVSYNTGEEEEIGNPINYVISSAITTDYHLIVYYSDPQKRISNEYNGIDEKYAAKNWTDLGVIKAENAPFIGLTIDRATIPKELETLTRADSIKYLNEQYPTGLQDNIKGACAVVVDNSETNPEPTELYAFDYVKNVWVYIGGISGGGGDAYGNGSLVGYDDTTNQAIFADMPAGGSWFVIEDVK